MSTIPIQKPGFHILLFNSPNYKCTKITSSWTMSMDSKFSSTVNSNSDIKNKKMKEELSVKLSSPIVPKVVEEGLSSNGLRFDRLQPSEQELIRENIFEFGQFVAREAVLDEEFWTAAWLRAESHWENRTYERYIDIYKRKFADQEFNAVKKRCKVQNGDSCACIIAVRKEQKNVKRSIIKSVVGTLDLNIRYLLQGETFPGGKTDVASPSLIDDPLEMTGSGRTTARSRVRSSSEPDAGEGRPKFNRRRATSKYGGSIPLFDNVSIKIVLAISFIAFFIILFLIRHLVNSVAEPRLPRAVTPLPAPKIMDLDQFQGEHKESLYWGTYRPYLYLGIRARTPQSLMAGLMWIGVKDGRYHLRHVCRHEDDLSTYGWKKHNGRDYGHQVLVDHGMILTTEFLKSKGDDSGYGGDWAVRIDVQVDKSKWNEEFGRGAQLFFYLADEGGNVLDVSRENLDSRESSLLASGSRSDIGDWQLHLKSKDDLKLHYSGFHTPHFHNLSDLVEENLASQIRKHAQLQLSDSSDESSNVLAFQILGGFPFTTDIVLISGTDSGSSRVEERINSLTGASLSNELKYKEQAFDEKIEKVFNLTEKVDSESVSAGKAAIGSLLGGIGYFYGQSKIALSRTLNFREHVDYVSYWPAELYTAVPSRSFFPRGFLWDEGFHQLLIWRWDIRISLDIIGHWLDLMNVDGWIPREQILGAEALSRVPDEFVPQHPTNGNPPTMFLALSDIITGLKNNEFTAKDRSEISMFLERSFVRLEAWFQWFNTTQSGKQTSSYYWHGRDNRTMRELNPKSLSSGLDDYPRASHPSEDERHLDLRCWMLLAADCMHSIEKLLDKETRPGKNYGSTAKLLSDHELLNQMHFDDAYGAYFDFGNHTEKAQLKWKEMETGQNYASRQLVRDVSKRPVLRFVPHIGYVSLFPFMGRIIPPGSWILEKQLELISNNSLLWTDYGLRSLAKTSSMYMKRNTEHDPPYWRGPIWINMNYRILSALHHYSKENGPYQDKAKAIYTELRSNLIRNIVRNYQETGFFWEQYDQVKGKGKGARPFTGWTSLVVLIMAEAYGTI